MKSGHRQMSELGAQRLFQPLDCQHTGAAATHWKSLIARLTKFKKLIATGVNYTIYDLIEPTQRGTVAAHVVRTACILLPYWEVESLILTTVPSYSQNIIGVIHINIHNHQARHLS